MQRHLLILVFLTLFGTSGLLAQEVMTLEKALEVAFEHSPSLIQSKLSLEQQQLNLKAQNASLKSQFSLDVSPFNYSRNNEYDSYNSQWYSNESMSSSASLGITQPIKWTDGTISLVNDFSWQDASNQTLNRKSTSFNHNLSLRIEQPIFTYNRTKMELQELEYALENSKLSYAMQELSIEQQVTTQFYNVYQQQKNLSTAKDEYNNQKQNYDIIKNKVEAGLVAREELFQAEVNLATSESSVYTAEINYENAKDNFKQLLGISLEEDVMVLPNTEITTVNVDVNKAVEYALKQRMELRQHEITLAEDLFAITRAKSENEFQGSISARIGLDALGEKVNNMYEKRGSRKARVKSSELAMESDQINLDEEKKSITLEVRQICRNLPTLIRQIEIKQKNIENAEHTYEINLEKYRNGNLTGMELQQYQNQLTTAKQEYTNAIIDYKLELLNLKIQTLWDFETNQSYLPVDLLK